MMKRVLEIFLLVLLGSASVYLIILGWTGITVQPLARAQGLDLPIQKIAVMPFFKGKRPEEMAEIVSTPLERFGFDQFNLRADADIILTRIVQRSVMNRFGEKAVFLEDVLETYEKIIASEPSKTPGLLAQKLGQALGADYVFLGNVWKYRDRNEAAYSAPSGAAVAFNVVLLKVETGQKIWKATFDKTQRTLSDNVLAIKGSVKPGLKWLSANELARLGVKEVFKKFPY